MLGASVVAAVTQAELAAVARVRRSTQARVLAARYVAARCEADTVASADVAVRAGKGSASHRAVGAQVRDHCRLLCFSRRLFGCLFRGIGSLLSFSHLRGLYSLWRLHFARGFFLHCLCIVFSFAWCALGRFKGA